MADDSANARNAASARDKLIAGVTVLALVLLALFLRVYWNMDAAQTDDGFVMSAGSDPYYHLRAITYIQENGWSTLITDPLLNYPYGALNPNPPLFQWSVAIAGAAMTPFFGGDVETATWWAMLWSPAIWGALTVLPTYAIGRDVFNRRTGILAGFLMAISTSAIDHTSLGAADHDAAILFFSVLAFWTYVRTVQAFRGDGNWVADWRDSASVQSGLSRFFKERRSGFGWAIGAGLATAGVALIWKGFPYVIGIMFAYVALQLVVDHWRNKDSTGIWFGTLVTFIVAMLVTTPFYSAQHIASWLKPVWFLLAAYVVFGAVMVPTRDLPTILVLPLFAVVGLLGVLAAFFVVPDVARSLLYATVYFKQTALYQTIAEAHPADFATIVFGIGPVPFFLALGGLVALFVRAGKNPARAYLFMGVWAIIALYMAQSAVRFVFNATPILALLAAWATVLVLDWADFRSIGRTMRSTASFWTGFKRSVNGWHVTLVILVAGLLVFPGIFLAVDAATPLRYDQERAADSEFYQKRFGAFGQGFLPSYWQEGFAYLRDLEDFGEDPGNVANRPAFLAWWDYGHWAIEVGEHPTVADNFQNGYEFAANFLLAENETFAVQLMAARSLPRTDEDGLTIGAGLLDEEEAKALIREAGVAEEKVSETFRLITQWKYAPALDLEKAVLLQELVREATETELRPDGVRIRYFATDIRMLPYDIPSTPQIDQTSIFYAPVVLAGDKPADYVELKIQSSLSGEWLSEDEFESRLRQVARYPNLGATGQRYEYKPAFFDSMYYRGFVGVPIDRTQEPILGDQLNQALTVPQPGFGMKHFRLAYANPQLRMLEFYNGAVITGTVSEEGEPLAGVTVTAYDDAGHMLHEELPASIRNQTVPDDINVPHDRTTTDADGSYRLTIPFSVSNGTSIVVTDSSGAELGRHVLDVSREEAETGAEFTHDFVVQKGSVAGFAFFDADENGMFNESAGDSRVSDIPLTIGGVNATTDDDGTYRIEGVSAGRQSVTVNSTDYEVLPIGRSVTVQPNTETTHNVPLRLKPVTTNGAIVYDADGDGVESAGDRPVANATVQFEPTTDDGAAQSTLTDADGRFTVNLAPGTYAVNVTHTADDVTYTTDATVTIERGAGLADVGTIVLTRADES